MTQASHTSSEGGEPRNDRAESSATLTGQHRALDEAAAKLVAAWDVDIDSHTPSEGLEALERLKAPVAPASYPVPASVPTEAPIPSDELPTNGASRWPWVLGLLAVLGAGGAWMWSGSDAPTTPTLGNVDQAEPVTASEPVPEAVPVAETEPRTDSEPPAATGSPAPATPVVQALPQTHSLSVRTIPRRAVLEIDGKSVGNPYTGEHSGTVEIVATARKYDKTVREVKVDADTQLTVTLRPKRAPVAKARPRARKRSRARAKASRPAKARRASKPQKGSPSAAGFVSSNPYQ